MTSGAACPIIRPMPPDPTTTIATLAAEGHTHLHIECRCGITEMPFRMIKGDHKAVTLDGLYHRLRCKKCLRHPETGTLRGTSQSEARGYMSHPGSGPRL